jgi:hypothetical protein
LWDALSGTHLVCLKLFVATNFEIYGPMGLKTLLECYLSYKNIRVLNENVRCLLSLCKYFFDAHILSMSGACSNIARKNLGNYIDSLLLLCASPVPHANLYPRVNLEILILGAMV